MDLPEQTTDELIRRLKRAEGQVRAVQRMLTDDSDCREIVTQISAASKALDQVGFRLLATGMATCAEDPDRAAADGYSVEEIERLFTKLA
ncbi:MAG: metal-sensitive transcriptional regulator [Microthrixaceae bacterium]